MDKLVLASASPRRRELMSLLGVPFEIIVSNVVEVIDKLLPPEEMVKDLALQKARAVVDNLDQGLVIGADTIVVIAAKIMGKPANEEEAFTMLKELSGQEHQVYTGIALVDKVSGGQEVAAEVTMVKFKELTDGEIRAYLATGEPFDKAGAYAIQGRAAVFIEGIKGDYNNVVGLPVYRLAQLLKRFNVEILSK